MKELEWVTVENMHEPIIDKEIFEKVQALRQVDTRIGEICARGHKVTY